MLPLAMSDEIASAALKRLLGINKNVLSELAQRRKPRRAGCAFGEDGTCTADHEAIRYSWGSTTFFSLL
jgi:hypothetical protein